MKTKLNKQEVNILINIISRIEKMADKFEEKDITFPDGHSTISSQLNMALSCLQHILGELS